MDLVTGGGGFIGRHVVRQLLDEGRSVRVLDLKAKPTDLEAEWLKGSLLNAKRLEEALQGVEFVYHLAAVPHFWSRDKERHRRVNLRGTRALLKAAKEAGVRRVVHCSTEAVLLPESGGKEIDGSRLPPLAAMPGPYTQSKHQAEKAALAVRAFDVVVVSPTAPIGPGDQALTPPMRMLSDLLAGRYPAYLECLLNLVDVRDVAQGHILAARRGTPGQRYILGGENLALSAFLERVGTLSGKKMPRRQVPAWLALASAHAGTWIADRITHKAPAATPEAVKLALAGAPLSSDLAKYDLGYRPRPLDQAITDAIADLKARRR